MAGSGDLASLRLLRELRWRIDEEITYGAHMALHVSIGLLFLGSGRASLSRSKAAIAALLIAFFPRFPRAAGDNQYHLQSLRHLWVLATDWRGLKAVDVETGVDVLVPLQIDLHAGLGYVGNGVADSLEPCQSLQVMAPCLLPPLCDIASVRVASERYYPSTLNFQHTSKIVHVKRRPGYLSYRHDPYALREGLREEQEYRHKKCHPGPACGKVSWAQPLQLLAKKSSMASGDILASYADDPALLVFAREFCDDMHAKGVSNAELWGGGRSDCLVKELMFPIQAWCVRVLKECVARDKVAALPVYLQLYHAALTIHWKRTSSAQASGSLRMALEYSDSKLQRTLTANNDDKAAFRHNFMQALALYIDALDDAVIAEQE
jgi:anaphase-promoting complex subunit 1